jgi:ABC-type microcin C transport system duplicated ATPase subunit YejF
VGLPQRDLRPLRRALQIVFQDPFSSLNPRMTVGDSIAEALVVQGALPRAEREIRVAGLLSRVGLAPESAARFPHAFSGGERQRIGIARALAAAPEALVLDEPLSSLDASLQAQMVNLLLGLQQSLGLAYLFIGHDLRLVRHVSDRIAVMAEGRIVEEADADELFARPRHPVTRAMLTAQGEPCPSG